MSIIGDGMMMECGCPVCALGKGTPEITDHLFKPRASQAQPSLTTARSAKRRQKQSVRAKLR